ncbi:hypothetical protein [Paenibacillus sp. SI8]|uniref:hypothetical protein n=1 Tax=unclassified Paenibacillus TaxID=185978 RepID=UPI003467DBC0
MRIPGKVKVGAMTYDVKIVDRPITVKGRECVGSIAYDKQLIEIRDESVLSKQSAVQTFWHEVFHAFTNERGLEWGDNDELYTDELAKAMHAFCVDNGLDFVRKAEEPF